MFIEVVEGKIWSVRKVETRRRLAAEEDRRRNRYGEADIDGPKSDPDICESHGAAPPVRHGSSLAFGPGVQHPHPTSHVQPPTHTMAELSSEDKVKLAVSLIEQSPPGEVK